MAIDTRDDANIYVLVTGGVSSQNHLKKAFANSMTMKGYSLTIF